MTRRPTSAATWTALGVVLLLFAAVMAVGAFTRFDANRWAVEGSPEAERLEREAYRDAQVSVALGLGAAFSMLAAFACLQRGRRLRKPQDEAI